MEKYVLIYLNILHRNKYRYWDGNRINICGFTYDSVQWFYYEKGIISLIMSLFGLSGDESNKIFYHWINNLPTAKLIKNSTNKDVLVFDSDLGISNKTNI